MYCVPHPRPQEDGRGQPRPARGVVAPVIAEHHAAGGEVGALRGQVGQQTLGHLQHRTARREYYLILTDAEL